MACVVGAKERRGGGEKPDQMIKKTLLQELTVTDLREVGPTGFQMSILVTLKLGKNFTNIRLQK